MGGLLSMFGLMRVSEHKDLVQRQSSRIVSQVGEIVGLHNEIAALRADAEKWRDRAAREKRRGENRKKARA